MAGFRAWYTVGFFYRKERNEPPESGVSGGRKGLAACLPSWQSLLGKGRSLVTLKYNPCPPHSGNGSEDSTEKELLGHAHVALGGRICLECR